MLKTIAILILITFIPGVELRGSIPFGVWGPGEHLHWAWVFVVCVTANVAVGLAAYGLIEWIIRAMRLFKPVERLWNRHVERTQKRIHESVEKYGEWALAVFIGIPLPLTGAYSGALAAFLLGMSFRKFFVANLLGVVMAGVLVTIAVLTSSSLLRFCVGWFR